MLYSGRSLAWYRTGDLSKKNKNQESTKSIAFRQLREHLLNGNWPAGFVLPAENVLKNMLGVGRPALRDAMEPLVARGALIKLHGHRTVVADDLNPKMLRFNPFATGPLDPEAFQDMQVFRQSVEVKCAELAATHATEDDIAALKRALKAMMENIGDPQLFSVADCDFHFTIINATDNTAFIMAGQALRGMYESYLNEVNQHCTDMIECMDAHTQVFNAIKNGDPQAAGKAMASLVAMAIQQTKKQPDDSR